MLQPHPWLSQHHAEASPFVLRGTLASTFRMDELRTSLPVVADAPGEQAQVKPGRNASEAPLQKLSVTLIDTYKSINQVHAEPTGSGAGAQGGAGGRG